MTRRARVAVAFGVASLGAMTMLSGATAAVAAGNCQPGSGPNLAGRHITDATLQRYQQGLQCANLTGSDLAGLSLIQLDFTGAIMKNADLQHADLTQATLSYADLSGANLTDATMGQVTAQHTKLAGANLSGADLTQADLTDADLSKANLSGTDFTQATLDGATFTGATGVPPWGVWIAIVAVLFLALLLLGTLRRGFRSIRAARGLGYSNATGSKPGLILVRGIIGSVLVALGFNLCVGGFIGEILSASGPPVTQTCTGPLCPVGVASGFIGIFGGVVLMIVGFIVRASGRSNGPVAVTPGNWTGSFSDSSPFN